MSSSCQKICTVLEQVLAAMGLVEEHLAVALSARSKAFMVFMDAARCHGSGRVSLRVSPLINP